MRSETQMMELILRTAREDDRIRAVMLNGSRANPNAPHDFFQDFDIVYFVTQVEPFANNMAWADRFGERMIYQLPEDDLNGNFVYLMQFSDGNRIDLSIVSVAKTADSLEDSLTVILLDKDKLFPPLDPPSEKSYLPQKPSAKEFADACNEFWWVSPYVAKGLWRDEITYAKHTMEEYLRTELFRMLVWSVGAQSGFTASPGKYGKYLRRYLSPQRWERLLQTYAPANSQATWDSWVAMADLYEDVAIELAAQWGYAYPRADAARVRAHIAHIRALPRDAAEMYSD